MVIDKPSKTYIEAMKYCFNHMTYKATMKNYKKLYDFGAERLIIEKESYTNMGYIVALNNDNELVACFETELDYHEVPYSMDITYDTVFINNIDKFNIYYAIADLDNGDSIVITENDIIPKNTVFLSTIKNNFIEIADFALAIDYTLGFSDPNIITMELPPDNRNEHKNLSYYIENNLCTDYHIILKISDAKINCKYIPEYEITQNKSYKDIQDNCIVDKKYIAYINDILYLLNIHEDILLDIHLLKLKVNSKSQYYSSITYIENLKITDEIKQLAQSIYFIEALQEEKNVL